MFLLPRLVSRSSRSLAVMLAGGAVAGAAPRLREHSRIKPN